MIRVIVSPAFTDADYVSQHEALVTELRSAGMNAEVAESPIRGERDGSPLELPFPPYEIAVHVVDVIEGHVLDLIISAVLGRVWGAARRGRRKGKERRVMIFDSRGRPLREVRVPVNAPPTEEDA